MPAEPNYDNVTRVEIIGPGGRVFSYFCEPGVAPDVQDDGRTLKVFVGDPVPWRTAMQRAAASGRAEEREPAVRATQNSVETPAEFPCLPHCGCDTTLMRHAWCQRADQPQEGDL